MSYHQQWQDYRIRGFLFWFAFLTYIPGIILVSIPLTRLLHSDKGKIGVIGVVAILWTVAVALTGIYKTRWKCPRCHQPFQQWQPGNPTAIASRCMHCGLPKGAQSDEQRG